MTNAPSATGLIEGSVTSLVRVTSYEDLQCGDCAAYRRMLDEQLLPKFAEFVAFEHRDFPLSKHAWARRAAIAARHFRRIEFELGIAFQRYCYNNLAAINVLDFAEHVRAFAVANGMDADEPIAALLDVNLAAQVDADHKEGLTLGVARTPTVFVDGRVFVETFSFQQIAHAIESALKLAGVNHRE